MALDPSSMTADELTKLMSAISSVNSDFASLSKSATRRRLEEEAHIKSIAKLKGVNIQQAEQLAEQIKLEEELGKKEEQRNKAVADAVEKSIGGLKNFAEGAIGSANSAYNSSEVFASVAPTLTLMGNTIKAVTDVVATAFTGIPFIGGIFSAADKALGLTIDITTKVMEMQLQNAQKMLNTYNSMSKTGLSFGGSLELMRQAAVKSNLGLDYFSKFVTDSADSLSKFSGSMVTSANFVGKWGADLRKTDQQLLVMYGGVAEFDSALAEYAARQANAGIDVIKNQEQLKKGALDYLYAQKALTELTGKNLDSIKKEQEAREEQAGYILAKKEIGETAPLVDQTLSLIADRLGPAFDKFGTEYIQRNGQIINTNNQFTQAQFGATAELVKHILDYTKTWKGTTEELIKKQADDLQNYQTAARERERQQMAGVAQYNQNTDNEYVKHANEVLVGLLKGTSKTADTVEAVKDFYDRQKAAGVSPDIPKIAGAIEGLNQLKITGDETTIKSLGDMASIATKLNKINEVLIEKFGSATPIFSNAVDKFAGLINKLLGEAGYGTSAPVSERRADANQAAEAVASARENGADPAEIAKLEQIEIAKARAARQAELEEANKRRQENNRLGNTGNVIPPTGTPTPGKESLYKGAESTAGGAADPALVKIAEQIAEKFGAKITALNDRFHQGAEYENSLHRQGEAADINSKDILSHIDEINQMLKGSGYHAERHSNAEDPTGGQHLHIEQDRQARKDAKQDAKPNSQKVGFTESAQSDMAVALLTDLNDKMAQMLSVTKDHRDTSEKILWAQA